MKQALVATTNDGSFSVAITTDGKEAMSQANQMQIKSIMDSLGYKGYSVEVGAVKGHECDCCSCKLADSNQTTLCPDCEDRVVSTMENFDMTYGAAIAQIHYEDSAFNDEDGDEDDYEDDDDGYDDDEELDDDDSSLADDYPEGENG